MPHTWIKSIRSPLGLEHCAKASEKRASSTPTGILQTRRAEMSNSSSSNKHIKKLQTLTATTTTIATSTTAAILRLRPLTPHCYYCYPTTTTTYCYCYDHYHYCCCYSYSTDRVACKHPEASGRHRGPMRGILEAESASEQKKRMYAKSETCGAEER